MNDEAQLAAEISSLTRQVRIMSHRLEPVWQRDQNIRQCIAATHGGPGKFNRATAHIRAPLFEGLTEIAVVHGKDKQIVKDMKRRVSAYTKELIRLRKTK